MRNIISKIVGKKRKRLKSEYGIQILTYTNVQINMTQMHNLTNESPFCV